MDDLTLDQFLDLERARIERFAASWRNGGEGYPERLPEAEWAEQLMVFEDD